MLNRGGDGSDRRKVGSRVAGGTIVLIIALLGGQMFATAQVSDQQTPSSSPNGQTQTSAPAAKNRWQAPQSKVLDKRSFFFPDLAHGGQPLTPGGKLRVALANMVSPATFLGSGFAAGIGQAANTPAGWGQGADAYGQRFGAAMANRASSNLLGNFFLCSVLHDDPRFFIMGDGSIKQSVKYALRRVVIIRKDNGGEAFNWPGIVGPLGAAGIANTYWPDAQRGAAYTFKAYGWALAGSAGVNLLKEYWPTITRKVLVPLGITHEPTQP